MYSVLNLYKNFSIVIAVLDSSSVMFGEIGYKIGLSNSIVHWLIFLNLVYIASISMDLKRLTGIQEKTLLCLALIIFYILLLSVFRFYNQGVVFYCREILTGMLIFVIVNGKNFSIAALCDFIVLTGFAFSFFSLILFWGYYYGLLDVEPVIISRGQLYYQGFGGYLNEIKDTDVVKFGSWYRNQSYWTEPARYAQFLVVPLFISLQKIFNRVSVRNIIFFLTIAFALILTFSVANYYGIILSVIIYYTLRKNVDDKQRRKKMLFKMIVFLSMSVVFFWLIYASVADRRVGENRGKVMSKGYSYYLRKIDYLVKAVSVLDEDVFGSQVYADNKVPGNAGMLGWAVAIGGVPLFFLLVYIYLNYLSGLLIAIRGSGNKSCIIYAGAFAFCVANMHYGRFSEVQSLFNIALFTTYLKNDSDGAVLL